MSTVIGPVRHTDARRTSGTHAPGQERARARRRAADVLEVIAVTVVVATAVLFLLDGGSSALTGGTAADRLVGLGRLTGLVGTVLLLLQLLLAARLPWVDRTYGHDRALVAHRRLSRVALPLLLAHAGALVLGYGARSGISPALAWLVEPVRMLGGAVPDMLTAFVALGVLVVVAVTSVNAARRRTRHETWHLVHFTAYAGVALSLPHQLSTGTDIAGHPVTRAFWLALYVATAGAVVVFRVLVPLWRSLRHQLVVEQVVPEGPGVVSVVVRGRLLNRLPVRAGQFMHWRFLTRGLWAAAHPWSLSAAPDGRRLRLTVRDLGDHSRRLMELQPGTRVVIEGPYGAFTTARRTQQRVLLIAAGIGITPVRAIVEELAGAPSTRPGDVTVLYRGNDERSLVLVDELHHLAATSDVRVETLVGPPVPGSWLPPHLARRERRADAATLRRLVPHLRDHDVYLCGPPAWMSLVRRDLTQAGVPASQVHDERFGW
ncbi:ferric reductase-like transmembrane domain-containing protein [Angustibacter sp. Root456]|uniref:ferredoxin reductase family protein n=1 Tax=Angustibacter sp. Root456 TaxID=1736539 RepID=UPI0006F1CA37|nr:ferric reductase-like transmembrane domain-containing protein [Angustibacter sp. Root456]KQX62721.1 oxidoreductase [Angustibacter sp. Root456]